MINSPIKTDRDLRISCLLAEILNHDQSSNWPFQNDAEKRAKKRRTVSICVFALCTVHLYPFSE